MDKVYLENVINDLRECAKIGMCTKDCTRFNEDTGCRTKLMDTAANILENYFYDILNGKERETVTEADDYVDNAVIHPMHYNCGEIEVWDAIADWGLGEGFVLGNVIKYVARAGRKDGNSRLKDLAKAREYIDKAIALEKAGKL